MQLIATYGSAEQIRSAVDDVLHHGRIFGIWNTWNTGTDDGVELVPTRSGYRMRGSKTFASGAGHIARAIVTGRLPDGGWQMCLVAMDRVDAEVDRTFWHPLGMRSSASHRITFHDVPLDSDELVGKPGDYERDPLFRGGTLRFAAAQVGSAQELFEVSCRYVQSVGRSGDPYQIERAGLALVALRSGSLWLDEGAVVHDRYLRASAAGHGEVEAAEELVLCAAMTRTAVERICLDVLELVERSVGARGLLQPAPIERMIRDLRLYLRQPSADATLAAIGEHAFTRTPPG
ncbi:MAG: acyl-CoA dehydrogenase [Chloroflexi bacterium]|nr:acyl-CoA dehydrogenase [Chloroflexota bacterium]